MKSDRPLPETLVRLVELQDITQREFSRRLRRRYNWGSAATISRFVRGEITPTPNAMENLAGALNLRPEVFAEYRMARQREMLDPDQVGFAPALRYLEQIEAAVGEAPEQHSATVMLRQADDEERAEPA
jgi:transcriptional regulator with XRE-family HTH domain